MGEIITIDDSGVVAVPSGSIMMTAYEIADLLGVMVPTVKGRIKTLLKSRQFRDCGGGGVVCMNGSVTPDYHGLEMVIAVAFQVDSYRADIFRRWIMRRLLQRDAQPIYIGLNGMRRDVYN